MNDWHDGEATGEDLKNFGMANLAFLAFLAAVSRWENGNYWFIPIAIGCVWIGAYYAKKISVTRIYGPPMLTQLWRAMKYDSRILERRNKKMLALLFAIVLAGCSGPRSLAPAQEHGHKGLMAATEFGTRSANVTVINAGNVTWDQITVSAATKGFHYNINQKARIQDNNLTANYTHVFAFPAKFNANEYISFCGPQPNLVVVVRNEKTLEITVKTFSGVPQCAY